MMSLRALLFKPHKFEDKSQIKLRVVNKMKRFPKLMKSSKEVELE